MKFRAGLKGNTSPFDINLRSRSSTCRKLGQNEVKVILRAAATSRQLFLKSAESLAKVNRLEQIAFICIQASILGLQGRYRVLVDFVGEGCITSYNGIYNLAGLCRGLQSGSRGGVINRLVDTCKALAQSTLNTCKIKKAKKIPEPPNPS